jgi:SAM-dependent methyltransferase
LGYSHIEFHGGLSNKVAGMAADVALCNLIPEFVKEGRVLEIGCASGARLELLQKLGWGKCIGSEFSREAAMNAEKKGFQILTGPVEKHLPSFESNFFDAIVASFVVEHLPNPFETTFRLAEKIKPGGQFIFSTINISTPDFKIYGSYWYNLDLPRHMVLFRVCDIIQMLKPHFKIERILYQSAWNDYIGSARYRIPSNCGILSWVFDRLLLKNSQRIGPILSLLGKLSLGSRIYISARKL